MYEGASWALSPERASTNVKMGKNLGQNTRGHRYITEPDKKYSTASFMRKANTLSLSMEGIDEDDDALDNMTANEECFR
jgi:hypothetical protein